MCKCIGYLLIALFVINSCSPSDKNVISCNQWTELELSFQSKQNYENPYTDVEIHAVFTNSDGKEYIRPGFWDGENTWKVRFAPPTAKEKWTWQSFCSNTKDKGLHQKTGKLICFPAKDSTIFHRQGFLKMSDNHRQVVYHNGKPFLMIGDTPWALPFRATYEAAKTYSIDRQSKGFNTALLMSVQPDMEAKGPRSRTEAEGFEVGFEDLPKGHLNEINIEYYQYLDSLISILVSHDIVPVYQPVFHGFGWKGLKVMGNIADSVEYARYTRYLLARYGARPAFWLLGGDNNGKDPGVQLAGKVIEQWDCYKQPTGIHYNPCDDYIAEWGDSNKCLHYNKSFQSAPWLDFQWCQTGHDGIHDMERVAEMYANKPPKAVANGEPTYEKMNGGKNGNDWWQGHEAWSQIMAGGTMGVVYGAASLWQWKLFADEPGWTDWASNNTSWEEALDFPGSVYPGYIAKAFAGMDYLGMEPSRDPATQINYLAKSGAFYAAYLPEGGAITFNGMQKLMPYRWFNPKTGKIMELGIVNRDTEIFTAPTYEPWVVLVGEFSSK